ncbi:alpha-1,2-fucosyltransferase [Spirosoma harenae]
MITFSQLGTLPWGRLGNQLFCIASTIGIAHRNNQPFVFPPWSYSTYFANPLPTGTVSNLQIYDQPRFSYNPVDLPTGNWDLRGSFQSESFFKEAESQVRHFFKPSPDVNTYLREKYSHLLSGTTCSLHVRRGDYVRQRAAFPPQPLAYYQHAIRQFPSDTTFLVFSDDIAWCQGQFTGDQFHFIEGEKDIIDLFLMSQCTHHIISNSSFSWWGAWLNPNPAKTVYCPPYWFGPAVSPRPQHYARDLYASGFTILPLPDVNPQLKAMAYALSYPVYALFFETIKLGIRTLRWTGLWK